MDYIFSYLPLTEDKLHVARIFAYIHFFFLNFCIPSDFFSHCSWFREMLDRNLLNELTNPGNSYFILGMFLGLSGAHTWGGKSLGRENTSILDSWQCLCPEKVAAQFLSGWNGHDWVSVPCTLWCVWSWCLLALLLQHLCLCLNAFSAQRSMGSFISRHGLKVPGS